MKNILNFLFLSLFIISIAGCVSRTDKAGSGVSGYKIEDIQGELMVGMPFQQLVKIVDSTPIILKNGTARFKMSDGDLWVRCATDGKELREILFWGTVVKFPDGTTIKKTSNDDTLKKMYQNPICIDISIVTEFNGQKRTGKCYYEQYDPGNISVEASEKGGDSKDISLILINNKYMLQKGAVPIGDEFKYLVGYMANLQLLHHLMNRGMDEATPVEKGRRNFAFESKTKPFVIEILNKKIVYPAPWFVKGFVEPVEGEKGFSFNIEFRVFWGKAPNQKIQKTGFSGFFRQKEKVFGDDVVVSEWKQFFMSGKGQLKPMNVPFGTFKELQK